MRMIQCSDCTGFTFEALTNVGVCSDVRGQDLDGNRAIEAGVARLVDLAHATGPDGRVDLIRAEANAGEKRHLDQVRRVYPGGTDVRRTYTTALSP